MMPKLDLETNICQEIQNKNDTSFNTDTSYPYYVHYRSYHRPFIH